MTIIGPGGPTRYPERRALLPVRQAERRRFVKWIIVSAAFVAMAMIVVTATVLWQMRQSATSAALADLNAVALLLASQAEHGFDNADLLLLSIASELAGEKIDNTATLRARKSDEATFRLLRHKLASVPQLDGLALIDANGDLVSMTHSYPAAPISLAARDYFAALRDHAEIDHYLDAPVPQGASGSFYLARRLTSPNGNFLGVVLGAMPRPYFESILQEVAPSPAIVVSLWRDDGTLLSRHPIGQAAATETAYQPLDANKESGVYFTADRPPDDSNVIVERRINGYPLVLSVSRSQAEMLAAWHRQAILAAAVVAAFLFLTALTAWHHLRQLGSFALLTEARARAMRESEARRELQKAVARTEQAAHELRESEARFRDVAEVSADWIWESDAHHRICKIFGDGPLDAASHSFSPRHALGKTRWEMAHADPETDPHWRAHKADHDAHRPFRNFRFSIAASEGEKLHFKVSGRPVFGEDNRFLGYRGTVTNETGLIAALGRAERAEALLRDAIDAVTEGFAIYDRDDRLVMCNEAYRRLHPESAARLIPGISFEEILRAGMAHGLYPEAIGQEEHWLAWHLQEHRDSDNPREVCLSDGRWVLISERPTGGGGRAGLRIDITALKRVEDSLRKSEERLARAQRVANTGSIERDLDSGQVTWSDETCRIMGLNPETFVPTDTSLLQMAHPEDRKMLAQLLERPVEAHTGGKMRYRILRPTGEVRMIYAEADVLYDQDDKPSRLVAVIKDVTEAEAATQRQAQLEAQLRHSEKLTALGTLAGGIAHDLNNILVPIQALSKLLMREFPAPCQARDDLATIVQASLRARDLVQQMLAFSRKREIVRERIDLAAVSHEALGMLRASVPRRIEFIEQFGPAPPLLADAGQIHQVVTNLVTNAAHAIGGGDGRITVAVAACPARKGETGEMIALTVRDTGCGMEDDVVGRIFEPFYTTKPVGEGTGLGLSVVHGIVAGHGGTIEVRSTRGQGSEFIVRLPSCGSKAQDGVADAAEKAVA